MPRSKRSYGDPAPATLANAIAYVHMAQHTRGLHMSTISKLMNLYEFAHERPHYRFPEEALKLAEASPLWSAYQWLTSNGFRLREYARHDLRSIEYWNPETGKNAFTDRHGNILIVPETGKWIIDGVDQCLSLNPHKSKRQEATADA